MKTLKLIMILWLGFNQITCSQYFLKSKSDSILLENDSVLLYVEGYRGSVEWWISHDLTDWLWLNRTNDTLAVRIDNSDYYRATITEGSCTPVLSDTIFLIEKLTITGSNQFTVDSAGGVFLLPSGIKVKIPRGAVIRPKEIRIDTISYDSVNAMGYINTGENITFLAGISVATDTFNFRKSVKIKIPLPDLYYPGLPVLNEYNYDSDGWLLSDEMMIAGIYELNGNLNPFAEIILRGSDKAGSPGKGVQEFSLNDIRSFFLNLYGDIFLGEDPCRMIGYSVVINEIEKSQSGGCTVTQAHEDIVYWGCDPPQKGTNVARVISPDCEPDLIGCPGSIKILKDTWNKIILRTEIGGFPLSDQRMIVTPSGNTHVGTTSLSTDSFGNAPINMFGDEVGFGSISIYVAYKYYLNTIYVSGNEGEEYNEYDVRLMPEYYNFLVTIYDLPDVMTTTPIDIICTSATVSGYVVDDNYDPVTECGVIFNGTKIPLGSGEGAFSGKIPDLIPGTTYTVIAYATNLAGTAYGGQVSFTTLSDNCAAVSSTVLKDTTCICSCTNFTLRTKVSSDVNEEIIERGVFCGTVENPENSGTKYQSGAGTGTFLTKFPDILQNTTYYIKGYAILSSSTVILGNQVTFSTSGTVTDIAGNTYKTISIGPQIWMAENLRTDTYNDGTVIQLIKSPDGWANSSTGAYCWYDNSSFLPPTGALYNFYAVQTGKLCPAGWHVPTNDELNQMVIFLIAKGFNYDWDTTYNNKLAKALASRYLWHSSPERGAIGRYDFPEKINATCFSALPGGYRQSKWGGIGDGYFHNFGLEGFWWTSTAFRRYHLTCAHTGINYGAEASDGAFGFSVRCVKD